MATEVVATQTPATTVLAPASGIKPSDLTSVSESAVPSTTDNAHVSSDEGSLDVDIESVTAFASLIRFHRRITFYSDSVQCTINVTYGVAGVIERNAPTLLFAGGMYGGRWNAPWVDYLCRQKGVRVIFIDRYVPPHYHTSLFVHSFNRPIRPVGVVDWVQLNIIPLSNGIQVQCSSFVSSPLPLSALYLNPIYSPLA